MENRAKHLKFYNKMNKKASIFYKKIKIDALGLLLLWQRGIYFVN